MQAVGRASASLRVAVCTATRSPWFFTSEPSSSQRPQVRKFHARISAGVVPAGSKAGWHMGAMRGTFALLGTSHFAQHKPSLTANGLLGWEQTRSMRHGQKRGKLGRSATDRWALLRNMVTDLIKHERIQTTVPKAKEGHPREPLKCRGCEQLKRLADKMITMGKESTLISRRRAGAILRTDESIRKLFGVLAPRYRERTGGYTRVLRCINNRKGDNAPMAWIEFIDREGELRDAKPPAVRLPYAKRLQHAHEKGDERLVEYFTTMQKQVLETTAERASRIEAKKIRVRGPDTD